VEVEVKDVVEVEVGKYGGAMEEKGRR